MRRLTCVLCLLIAALTPTFAQAPGTADAAGLVFKTLSAEDLDAIQKSTGYRLGVQIVEVKPNTPGAAAGYQVNDLVFAVGQTGVDTAEKAATALRAAQGQVAVASALFRNGEYKAQVVQLNVGAGPAAGQAQQGQPGGLTGGGLGGLQGGNFGGAQAGQGGAVKNETDPVAAYFDILDFTRTQAWGRKVTTSAADRQRSSQQLMASWNQMNPQTQAQIMQIPAAWTKLQQQWNAASEAEKAKLRAQWREQILTPGNAYPAPANAQKFTADGNLVSFEYPGDWTGGLTEIEGTPFLFIGPNGSQANWRQVFDTPNSPSGALFALVEISAEMKNMTFVQGARVLAQHLMPNGLANLKEVQVLPIGEVGAVLTLVGKFPGQNEERFYWVGVTKFGSDKVFAGRMGGPVAQAEELLPAFSHMLATLQLNPPQATGEAYGAWQTAWSRVETAAISESWAKFHQK